tara:strand:+ start:58 stop:696 length:639 start_codon:yes stop_codon:yes gene_type:complete
MSNGQKQLNAWSGTFGEKYVERNNVTLEVIEKRRYAFNHIFEHIEDSDAPGSILEAGCNIGINIHALSQITDAALHVVEPNQTALNVLLESGVVPASQAHQGSLQALPLKDSEIDLVFTSGVLIHIPDDVLEIALSEIHRVSRKYILALEYFSPDPHTVPYHGHTDFLFKRDYGSLFLDTFSDIEHVANGFFWRRTTGLDNLNWWLFRKKIN